METLKKTPISSDNMITRVRYDFAGSGWRHGTDLGIAQLIGRMPNALPEEGSTMRIQSVTEVNTNYQSNPYYFHGAGSATTGKSASRNSFEECLRSQIQDSRTTALSRNAEWYAGSLLMGYYMLPGVTFRPELKLRARAYESPSDL